MERQGGNYKYILSFLHAHGICRYDYDLHHNIISNAAVSCHKLRSKYKFSVVYKNDLNKYYTDF
jgi:hypothetical protein